MGEIAEDAHVSIYRNEYFYFIKTLSWFNLLVYDYTVPVSYLAVDVDNVKLGEVIKELLKKSNKYDIRASETPISRDGVINAYNQWVKEACHKCNLKTKRQFFKNMSSCNIVFERGLFLIKPMLHKKLELWSGDGFTDDDNIILPQTVSNEELGKAVKEGMSRCRNSV
nr:contact-dependent growth inhibition system immunity protein [Providencia sp. wls1943]